MRSTAAKIGVPFGILLGALLLLQGVPCSVTPTESQTVELGIAYAQIDRGFYGETLLRRVLKEQPRHYRAHYGLGMVAYQDGRYPEAENEFKAATHCAGANLDCFLMLGVSLQLQGKLKEALPIYKALAHYKPDEPKYAYNLGMMAYKLGEKNLARQQLTNYLRLAPQADDRDKVLDVMAKLKGA